MTSQANPLTGMEMTPLPIPDASTVKVQPARPPEPYPTEAGYARKGGQAANIIANFLQGMAAGKAYGEQRMQKQAQYQVMNAQWQYQFLQGIASDPNQTKEKRDQATKLLPGAWQDMIGAYQKYVSPSEEEQKGKSKLRKAGERVKGSLTAQRPQLISAEQFDMLKKMGPMASMPQQPTTEQKEKQLDLQNRETQQKRMDTAMGELDEANKLIGEGALRDPEKRFTVLERVTMANNTLGNMSPKDLPSEKKERYDDATTQAATAIADMQKQFAGDAAKAYDKQRRGGTLTPQEQQVLGLYLPPGKPPDPMTIFMNMKGQEYTDSSGRKKTITTDLDAYNAFLDNEASNAAKTKQRDFDAQQQPVKDALRSKYRLEHGGQEPTKDELNREWITLYSGASGKPGEANKEIFPDTKQRDAAQTAMNSVRGMYDGKWGKFFTDRNATTDAKGKVSHHGAPDLIMKSRNDFSAEDQKEWDRAAQSLVHELQDRGFSLDQISTIVGREAVEHFMTMQPPPNPSRLPGTKRYKIKGVNPKTGKEEELQGDFTGSTGDIQKSLEGEGWKNVSVTE